MSDTLIKVEGVSKKFCRSLKKSLWYGMQDLGSEIRGHRHGGNGELRPDEFWAVKDVSFELKRGECLGLIGGNGAGKTTLLRMLNGLIKPDCGKIEMRGRVGALIALGAGFNPILTGRENIAVNASILGLNKSEIKAKISEIIDFSEIGDFIDAPVQSYSSGMQVRLGFSVAVSLVPDIIILDEVLAVGDRKFRHRCFNKIDTLRKSSAVIFVSHSEEQISRISQKALYLKRGVEVFSGDVMRALELYSNEDNKLSGPGVIDFFYPVTDLDIQFNQSEETSSIEISFSIRSSAYVRLYPRLVFFQNGTVVAEFHHGFDQANKVEVSGKKEFSIKIPELRLRSGNYAIGFNLVDPDGSLCASGKLHNVVRSTLTRFGECPYQLSGTVLQ